LVVELDVVEVDEVSDLLVDSDISSIFIVFLTEIRGLRSMGKTWSGIICLNFLVNAISQASPRPLFIASLSSQSISTPSRVLFKTKLPNFVAHETGSCPPEVGFSVAPKALTRILIPFSLKSLLQVFRI